MELCRTPATPFVAGFNGSPRINLFAGDVARALRCGTYGIRPEHVSLSADSGKWQRRRRNIERPGEDAVVFFGVDGTDDLVVRTEGEAEVAVGNVVFAAPMAGRAHRFP
jgi:multiple sugar transport system ATP-binding protein